MSERELFEQWSKSPDRETDFLTALTMRGSNVNRTRHTLTGWLGRARIAEQEKAELVELVELVREAVEIQTKPPSHRNELTLALIAWAKKARAILAKHEQEKDDD